MKFEICEKDRKMTSVEFYAICLVNLIKNPDKIIRVVNIA